MSPGRVKLKEWSTRNLEFLEHSWLLHTGVLGCFPHLPASLQTLCRPATGLLNGPLTMLYSETKNMNYESQRL